MLRDITSNEIFTILIVVSLLFIAIAKFVFQKRFNDLITLLGNSKYLKIYTREQKFFDSFDALLFVNLILSSTIFLFLIYQNETFNVVSQALMFKIAVGFGVFILIKILIERLIGSLFEIDEIIDSYLFQKTSYKNLIGLILLPINAILIYSIVPSEKIFYIIFAIIILVNCIGILTSFKSHQSVIKNNLFYFILYLCALEISPYIILYRFITNE